MFLTDQKKRVLLALRDDGPQDHAELMHALERPSWHVRQDLDDLKRDRLVRKVFERRRVAWHLTELGEAECNRLGQLSLEALPWWS